MSLTCRQKRQIITMLKSENESSINKALIDIRSKHYRCCLDHSMLILIVRLMNVSNDYTLNLALSIVANACRKNINRHIVVKYNGCDSLILILKKQQGLLERLKDLMTTNASSSNNIIDGQVNQPLLCRAWRLAGNLAESIKICKYLLEKGLAHIIQQSMAVVELLEPDTCETFFRTVRKSYHHKFPRNIMPTKKIAHSLLNCLQSQKESIVTKALGILLLIAPQLGCMVEKELIKQLAAMSDNKLYFVEGTDNCMSILVLANLLRHCDDVSCIEGTGAAEVLVKHIKSQQPPDKVVIEAVCVMCREGAVRNMLKNHEMLPLLIDAFINGVVPPARLILTLLLFQYDQESIQVMADSKVLISFLMERLDIPESVQLLQIIARFSRPLPALVDVANIDKMLLSDESLPLLVTIGRCSYYFETLVLSERVWALAEAGCPLHEVGTTGYGEGIITHHLSNRRKSNRRRTVILAVPFLLSPESKKLIVKLLQQHDVLSEILSYLKDSPTDMSVVAAIARLIQLFPDFKCSTDGEGRFETEEQLNFDSHIEETQGENDTVTFELDCGKKVVSSRRLLCSRSPVMNAMLNGHFSEAGKDVVKLPNCSHSSFASLVLLMTTRNSIKDLSVNVTTHLEMVALAERFLLHDLGETLTNALLPLSLDNCPLVYLWSLTAGHSRNADRLRAHSYSAILKSRLQLYKALDCARTRQYLIEDISGLLNDCLLTTACTSHHAVDVKPATIGILYTPHTRESVGAVTGGRQPGTRPGVPDEDTCYTNKNNHCLLSAIDDIKK